MYYKINVILILQEGLFQWHITKKKRERNKAGLKPVPMSRGAIGIQPEALDYKAFALPLRHCPVLGDFSVSKFEVLLSEVCV